jgi:hypothetical protein
MNRRDLIHAIAACEAAAKEFRAALGADALHEWEGQGVAPTWRLPGVTVSCSVTHPTVQVVDEAKFREWVKLRYPHQIETVTRVFPAFQQKLLEEVAQRGDPPSSEDDEVIPGLAYDPGGAFRSLSIRPSHELVGQFKLAAREMVAGRRPLALPTGGDDD